MADTFSREERSRIMSLVRSKDTSPEKIVFSYLRKSHVYFQRHYSRAIGNPDIALPRKKRAVFVDGDFWHGRNYQKVLAKHEPDSYWIKKITRNIERDKEQRAALRDEGWQLLVVWESDVLRKSTRQQELEKIKAFLTDTGVR